jgi:hypothetical protein
MVLISKNGLSRDDALRACRLAENDLRKTLAALTAPRTDSGTLYVNADTGGTRWRLARGGQHMEAMGALLVLLFNTAAEHGWWVEGLFSRTQNSMFVNLRPCNISGKEALKLSAILEAVRCTPARLEESPAFDETERLLRFFGDGPFELQRM